MTTPLSVDITQCRNCGTCVAECVHHLVARNSAHVDHTDPRCERCLHCYAICPAGAIRPSAEYAPLAEADAWHEITPQALESFLACRRSNRRFAEKPVPEDVIAQVVAAGRLIPSGGNRHAYEFTVLTDPAIKRQLLQRFAQYYGRIRRLMENPMIKRLGSLFFGAYERAFLNDPDYGQRMKELLDRFHNGDDPVFYHAPAVLIVHTREIIPTPREDSILAGFSAILMAQALGLATCFVSLAHKGISADKRCKELVGLAPDEDIHAVILLGYPDVSYRRPAPKPEGVVHGV